MDKVKLEQSISEVLGLDNEFQLNVWYDDYGSNRVFVQVVDSNYEEQLYMLGFDKDNSKVIMVVNLNAEEIRSC